MRVGGYLILGPFSRDYGTWNVHSRSISLWGNSVVGEVYHKGILQYFSDHWTQLFTNSSQNNCKLRCKTKQNKTNHELIHQG